MLRTLLLICYSLSALYGAWNIFITIRKLRVERHYVDELLNWSQPVTGFWRYEPDALVAIAIHRMAVFATATLGLVILLRSTLINLVLPGIPGGVMPVLTGLILAACVAFSGLLMGQSLAGPLAEHLGGEGHYALSGQGVLYGGRLFAWPAFSGWSVNDDQTLIQLWSRRMPGAVAFTLLPSSLEMASRAIAILESGLPGRRCPPPGALQRSFFSLVMLALVVVWLPLAWVLASLPAGLALILNALLVYLLVLLGERTIMGLIYGNQSRPAPSA